MSAPTRPGWYRVCDRGEWSVLRVEPDSGGVLCTDWYGDRCVAEIPLGGREWGARVEFPGDEPKPLVVVLRGKISGRLDLPPGVRLEIAGVGPAAGPLTPDSEGWWWHRCGEPAKPEGMCDWQPRHVAVCLAGPDRHELVFDYGRVKDGGRWGGRAVPPVTPAVEREADAQRNQLPPGWIIERLGHGAWWCAERETPPMPITGFSRASRHGAIAAARACVRKREAEPDPPEGWVLRETLVGDWRVYRAGDLGCSSVFETRREALAHARAGGVAEPEPGEPEQPWAWVDACPEGQRREQTLEDGAAIETRIVDRRDEP